MHMNFGRLYLPLTGLWMLALLLAASCVQPGPPGGPGGGPVLQQLAASPKLLEPERALLPYRQGQPRARFIVQLQDPWSDDASGRLAAPQYSLKTEKNKARRREAVRRQVQAVLRDLGLPSGVITHRYEYMSGFAVLASAEQLLEIVRHPKVLRVEGDFPLEPHAQ